MDFATLTWLSLGLGLGLVHAFDADHVMALSVFATRGRSAADGVRSGLRWALGHGLAVVAVGCGLLFLGQAMPDAFSSTAERGVGIVMIGLGIWVWIELARQRGHLHFHDHDDLPPHAHWHSHRGEDAVALDDSDASSASDASDASDTSDASGVSEAAYAVAASHAHGSHRHEHGPFFVGGLHGLAGSAPILAVLPAASQSPLLGAGYLLIFALGVALAMAIVSGAFGHLVSRLHVQGATRRLTGLRALSASGSIGLGLWLLVSPS